VSHPLLSAPIGRSLFRLAGPTTALMLVQILVAIAEVYFVGRLGIDALAGNALVIPFSSMMLNIANGAMGGGVAASLARALGAGRLDDARAVVVHALVLAFGLGVLFMLFDLLFARTVFGLLGGGNTALTQALSFSHIFFGGAIAMWTNSFLAALLRGSGDAATPSLYGLVTSIAYVALAGVLMLGVAGWARLGLAGLAVAAIAATLINIFTLAHAVWRGALGFSPSPIRVRLRWKVFRDILRTGALGSLTTVTASLAAVLVTGLVGRFGVAALAGYGIGARLEFMVAPVAFGIGSGLTTLVGVAVGADAWPRAVRATWIGGLTAFLAVGLIGWTVALWPAAWPRLFTADTAVMAATTAYLRHVAPFYGLFGFGLAVYFASQGAGRMAVPVVASITRTIVATAGGWILITQTTLGLDGVFIAIAAGMISYGGLIACALFIAPWQPRPERGRSIAPDLGLASDQQ
jgi:putative MATE family efflux protein